MRALLQVIDNPNSEVGADFEKKKSSEKQSFLPLLKKLLLFWILSKWGGEGPAHFFSPFHKCIFGGVYFLQSANNLNFKLFF